MTEEEYAAELERQRGAFVPWLPEETRDRPGEQAAIQALLAQRCGARFGRDCYVAPDAEVATDYLALGDRGIVAGGAILRGALSVGADSSVEPYAHIAGRVTLGAGVCVGRGARLFGFAHGTARSDAAVAGPDVEGPPIEGIEIGDGTWIGANAIVTDGVAIGPHCIVGDGAVVTRSFKAFQVIAGNPARALHDRRDAAVLPALRAFGQRVRAELPAIVAAHCRRAPGETPWFVDSPGDRERRVQPWCDAVALCAMIGCEPPVFARDHWIGLLRGFQDPATGLVPDRIPGDPAHRPPRPDERLAPTVAVQHALQCLGASLARPVGGWCGLSAGELRERLARLDWREDAWGAGDWVEGYAGGLRVNRRVFGQRTELGTLFAWLDGACSPVSGLWGASSADSGWLLPVNGFQRLIRGTYAQFARPLPHPAATLDTLLTHARDPRYFGDRKGSAANVLGLVQPLWLCLRQSDHRRAEAERWVRDRLPLVLAAWVEGEGFASDLSDDASASGRPSLRGSLLWLETLHLMAELLGLARHLGYDARGAHRAPAIRSETQGSP